MDFYIKSIEFDNGVKYQMRKSLKEDLAAYRVLKDGESPWRRANPRPGPARGVPAVVPTSPDKNKWPDTSRCKLLEAQQLTWANCLSFSKYGKPFAELKKGSPERAYIISKFKGLTGGDKFFTDHHGSENSDNYISGQMTGQAMQQESKVIADDIVYSAWAEEKNNKGKNMVRIVTFDVDEPVPAFTIDLLDHPAVIEAKIIYPGDRMAPFDQLDGAPVLVPLFTQGQAWMPASELQRIR